MPNRVGETESDIKVEAGKADPREHKEMRIFASIVKAIFGAMI
jgi:hypothetical protein